MTTSHTEQLKLSIIEIDNDILSILLPHHQLTDLELHKIAALEQARAAAQRLLTSGAGVDPAPR